MAETYSQRAGWGYLLGTVGGRTEKVSEFCGRVLRGWVKWCGLCPIGVSAEKANRQCGEVVKG